MGLSSATPPPSTQLPGFPHRLSLSLLAAPDRRLQGKAFGTIVGNARLRLSDGGLRAEASDLGVFCTEASAAHQLRVGGAAAASPRTEGQGGLRAERSAPVLGTDGRRRAASVAAAHRNRGVVSGVAQRKAKARLAERLAGQQTGSAEGVAASAVAGNGEDGAKERREKGEREREREKERARDPLAGLPAGLSRGALEEAARRAADQAEAEAQRAAAAEAAAAEGRRRRDDLSAGEQGQVAQLLGRMVAAVAAAEAVGGAAEALEEHTATCFAVEAASAQGRVRKGTPGGSRRRIGAAAQRAHADRLAQPSSRRRSEDSGRKEEEDGSAERLRQHFRRLKREQQVRLAWYYPWACGGKGRRVRRVMRL